MALSESTDADATLAPVASAHRILERLLQELQTTRNKSQQVRCILEAVRAHAARASAGGG